MVEKQIHLQIVLSHEIFLKIVSLLFLEKDIIYNSFSYENLLCSIKCLSHRIKTRLVVPWWLKW